MIKKNKTKENTDLHFFQNAFGLLTTWHSKQGAPLTMSNGPMQSATHDYLV